MNLGAGGESPHRFRYRGTWHEKLLAVKRRP
jgi:hypothetical protein